jgi:Protein of unknown function (DUF1569)
MKLIFDNPTRDELINRINLLNDNNTAQWGKMTLFQMLKHCTLWEDMMQGKTKYKRKFLGYIFGKMALKDVIKDDSPLRKSTPTIPELIITGDGNIEAQKAEWISKIKKYDQFSNSDFVHPFFGEMTVQQIGYLVYKHIDHHLRQFNG